MNVAHEPGRSRNPGSDRRRRAHFAGLAANLCLPGAIGGDTVRAGLAQAAMKDGAQVVAGATVDRLIDMVALLTLSCLGLILTWESAEGGHMIWPVALVLLAALAGMVALPRLLPLPWRYVPSLPGKGFAHRLADALAGMGRKTRHAGNRVHRISADPVVAGPAGLVAGHRGGR